MFRFVSSRYSGVQADLPLDVCRTFQMGAAAEAIESALAELRGLPAQVSSWQVQTGPDATDDPAVWVWVMLEDEEVDFQTRSRLREMVRNQVRHETKDGSWVCVRFRGASESVQTPVSLHADLLRQARQLALREPGRPLQASLRRAISASYYALSFIS